jgi:hypothetical protein
MRAVSSHPSRGKSGGWIHRLGAPVLGFATRTPAAERVGLSHAELQNAFAQTVSAMSDRLPELAEKLGVSVVSLDALDAGWRPESSAWSFPMRDDAGRLTGLRLRGRDGRKFSLTGGHEGLFIPAGQGKTDQLLACEGPTSLAALMDLGFPAVGRPSCYGAVEMLGRYAMSLGVRELVIVGDKDEIKTRPDGSQFRPGIDGAMAAAKSLSSFRMTVKVLICPVVKDCRDWLHAGATHDIVRTAISLAKVVKH